jgi:endonuclease/exonuclease/phosphatase family metal-dependent hydrolase
MVHWNANGIQGKIREFTEFLDSHTIDLALVSETHLNPTKSLKVRNFNVIRQDRPLRRGGGVAILVRHGITHIPIPTSVGSTKTVAIEIPIHNLSLQVVAAYKPPLVAWDFEELAPIFNRNTPTILGGDLNSKNIAWGSSSNNLAGVNLHEWLEEEGIDFSSPFAPTHYRPPDVLDICLVKNFPWTVRSEVLQELSSDHNPVIVTIDRVDLHTSQRALTRTNWEKFTKLLEETNIERLPLKTPSEVDLAAGSITSQIQDALKASTITLAAGSGLYFSPDIQDQKRDRNRLRRLYQKTGDPAAKRDLRRTQNAYSRALDEHFNNEWEDWMQGLDIQDNSLW